VSVRDASGHPVTGGMLQFNGSSVSQLPGLPGASASTFGFNGATLDGAGNTTIPVPEGITLNNTRIILKNGLIIPFQLHPVTGTGTCTSFSTNDRDSPRGRPATGRGRITRPRASR